MEISERQASMLKPSNVKSVREKKNRGDILGGNWWSLRLQHSHTRTHKPLRVGVRVTEVMIYNGLSNSVCSPVRDYFPHLSSHAQRAKWRHIRLVKYLSYRSCTKAINRGYVDAIEETAFQITTSNTTWWLESCKGWMRVCVRERGRGIKTCYTTQSY